MARFLSQGPDGARLGPGARGRQRPSGHGGEAFGSAVSSMGAMRRPGVSRPGAASPCVAAFGGRGAGTQLARTADMGRLRGMAAWAPAAWLMAAWAGGAAPPAANDWIPRDYLDSFLTLPDRFDTPQNAAADAKIALGRMLFFDPILSRDNTISCASCHDPKAGFADPNRVSKGVAGKVGTRNAPTVLNAAYNGFQFWDGRANTLEEQAEGPVATLLAALKL